MLYLNFFCESWNYFARMKIIFLKFSAMLLILPNNSKEIPIFFSYLLKMNKLNLFYSGLLKVDC